MAVLTIDDENELDDAEFASVFRLGVLWGIPVSFVIIGALIAFAVPSQPWLFLVAIWPALVGGWFFGGVVALIGVERHHRTHVAH
jgi:surface polysaccharide O-acyltransferase-like enzyme